ncbi:tetratricopeptide repeat protein [Desulfolithobacter sp.]
MYFAQIPFLVLLIGTALACASCSESPEKRYQRLNSQAQQYLAAKQYSQAIATWNELLSLNPDAPNIYYNLAKTYELSGQYPEALQAFQKHLSRHPDSQETLRAILKIQLQIFDVDGARTSWEKLTTFPDSAANLVLHGDLLAAQERYLPATEEYRKALALDPDNQMALARLAIILLGQNKTAEAAAIYEQLAAQQPKSPGILLQMGNYWLLTGEREKADRFLQQALDQAPNNQNLQVQRAELYLESGDYAKAASIYKTLMEQAPENRFYKKMELESLLLDEQFDQAKSLLDTLSPAENQDVDFLLLKGKYYLNTGEHLVAASQLELALEKEPRLPIAHYLLALAHLASGQNNLGQKSLITSLTQNSYFTAAELTLADYYYKTGEYDLALEHVQRIQEREPENARAFQIQGNIQLARKQYNDALTGFNRAFLLDPKLIAPLYYTSIISSAIGKSQEALALLQELIGKQPDLADATLLYTRILCQQGRQEEAQQYLRQALSQTGATPYLYHIYGLTLLSSGNKKEAVNAFEQALQTNPEMKETYLQLFKLYPQNSRKLEQVLLRAINRIKNFEEAQIRLASYYTSTGQPEKAIDLLQEALSRSPDSPLLANNLAWLYLEHQPDNLDETLRLATLAYDSLSDNAAISDTLGWVYYKKNMPVRAGWLLEEAAGREPDNPQILYHLAMIQLKQKQVTLAKQNLLKAKAKTSDSHLLKTLEAVMQSLP